MLTYDIKIYERNAITTVKVDSLAETLKLDESLDSGILTIPRASRKESFRRFSKVQVKITDSDSYSETRFYLVYTTESQLDSKGTYKTYTHTIGLIEPIKWLEKFQVGSLSFRQPITTDRPKKTVLDYVDRVLNLAPFVPYYAVANTRIVKLDQTFSDKIDLVEAPQMDSEKKNLREHLISIFKIVDAIPRMYYEDGMWYLTGDFINQRKLLFEVGDDIIDYKEQASGENFAQSAEIFHENTIPDDDAGVIYEGSITDYISYRSSDIIVGENNLKLVLSQNMSELKNIWVLIETLSGVEKVNWNDYCKEKKVYDTLEFDGGKGTQSHSFYWTYRSNEINGLNETFNAIFEEMAIEKILDSYPSNDGYDNIIFQVEYVPYYETMRSISYREDKDPYVLEDEMFDKYSGIQINQQERLNYLYDLTDNIYGQIQRLGVETVSISKKHYTLRPYHPDTNPNGIYQMGDYTSDGYIVTKVERIYARTHIIARYELSKNWNRIAQFIQIDQEFRPYEISMAKQNATVKRDILFKIGFVEVSTTENSDLGNVENLKETFMKTFDYQLENNVVSTLKMSVDNKDYYVIKPIGALAEKNGLKWKLDMPDTKLAGKRVLKNQGFANLVKTQEGVYYTDDIGEIENIKLFMQHNILTELKSLYAPMRTSMREFSDNLPYFNKKWKHLVNFGTLTFLEQDNQMIVEVDNYESLPQTITEIPYPYYPNSGEVYLWFITLDDYAIYEGTLNYDTQTVSYSSQLENGVAAIASEPIYELPQYRILKDSGEVLGFEIHLPIMAKSTEFNRFIIGEHLIKENTLIKPREEIKYKKFVGLTERIGKKNTKKIELTGAEPTSTITEIDIVDNKIIVPSSIYANDYYAIVDDEGNLYLGVNQVDLDGTKTVIDEIYFNFIADYEFVKNNFDISFEYLNFNLNIDYKLLEILKENIIFNGLDFNFKVNYSLLEVYTQNVGFEPLAFEFNVAYDLIEIIKTNINFTPIDFDFNVNYKKLDITNVNIQFNYLDFNFDVAYELTSAYTIDYYNLAGGTNDSRNPSAYGESNIPFPVFPASRTGYKFVGWYSNPDFYGNPISSIGNAQNYILYAKWQTAYAVNYNLNGGANDPDNPVAFSVEDTPVVLEPASRNNYSFEGWFEESNFSGVRVYYLTELRTYTLYAKWEFTGSTQQSWTQTGSSTDPNAYTQNETLGYVPSAETSPGVYANNYTLGYRVRVNDGGFPTTTYYWYQTVYSGG